MRVSVVFALPRSVTRERWRGRPLLTNAVAFVLAFDNGQYIREVKLILGKQVMEFAFEFEFTPELGVNLDEGQFRLFGG
ncbi:hypothetical protein D3C80_1864190 [compost metagenome]